MNQSPRLEETRSQTVCQSVARQLHQTEGDEGVGRLLFCQGESRVAKLVKDADGVKVSFA